MFIYKSPVIHFSKYSIILSLIFMALTGPYFYLPKTINALCADHITRHDMGVEESIGESSYQFCIQWIFYLVLVSSAVRANGPKAATEIAFDDLKFSSISSIISLSLGQFKVLISQILFRLLSKWFSDFSSNIFCVELK